MTLVARMEFGLYSSRKPHSLPLVHNEILGIHHVTAIATDPQRNINFYTSWLGLRLVKLTVNFDDPNTYHLYYGDELGHPGTILSFFPWPSAPYGRLGTGQLTAISFSIPEGALEFWMARFKLRGIEFHGPTVRFSDQVLSFADPDGLRLELVAHKEAEDIRAWTDGPIPQEHAIRGFRGVTLSEQTFEATDRLLTDTFGFRAVIHEENTYRYQAPGGGRASLLDIIDLPRVTRGTISAGSVHHLAWRTRSDEEQKAWRQTLVDAGLDITPVVDRRYFHSVYFREPGGVLFEIATDPPGFTVDESAAELGTHLMLPPWLETARSKVERSLPKVQLPSISKMR
jgi:catechol 2,3-dioxygenase-like lactoylglutathione lyase family enzyme